MADITQKAGLSVLLVAILLGGCSEACQNTVVERWLAPNGQNEAVLFQRDCGATTGFSTQVSLVRAGADPDAGGNIFRADDDHGKAKTGSWGGPWAEVRWNSPNELVVRYAEGSRIFDQETSESGVTVRYQAVSAQP
jgi:hypothetical protein